MAEPSFCVACKDRSAGQTLWLSAAQDSSGAFWCDVAAGNPNPGAPEYWAITPIVGTDAYYLMNQSTNLYASFDPGGMIALRPLDIFDPGFIIKLDDVGDGWVAINRTDKNAVFQAQGAVDGSPVVGQAWNASDSQMWKFADPVETPATGLKGG
jgi:hypothetical protein